MFSSFFVPSAMTFCCFDLSLLIPNAWHGTCVLSGEFCGEFFVSVFGSAAVMSAGGFSIGADAFSIVLVVSFVFVAGVASGVAVAGVPWFPVNVLSIVFVAVVSAGAAVVAGASVVAGGGAVAGAVVAIVVVFVAGGGALVGVAA